MNITNSIDLFNKHFCVPRGYVIKGCRLGTTSSRTVVCIMPICKPGIEKPVKIIFEEARYNPNNEKAGIPFSEEIGRRLAIQRAKRSVQRYIKAFEGQNLGKASLQAVAPSNPAIKVSL